MDYIKLYVDFLEKQTKIFRPLTITCDSSNGTTGMILEKLLPKVGLKNYTLINNKPDPDFKAHGPNPLLTGALQELQKTVIEKKSDLGIAFDADGDRVFFVDEKGQLLPSYVTAALIFIHTEPPFVSDELVYQALYHMKIFPSEILHASRVGVFFIKEKMKEVRATAGAEFSGHFYFKDFFGADSGIFTMMRVLSILSQSSQTLSQFAAQLPPHIVRNEDIKIAGKTWEDIEERVIDAFAATGAVIERREGITVQTKTGWVNVRPSNTEPILRIYAGAKDEASALKLLQEMKALV